MIESIEYVQLSGLFFISIDKLENTVLMLLTSEHKSFVKILDSTPLKKMSKISTEMQCNAELCSPVLYTVGL
jgi:hypothetical protein